MPWVRGNRAIRDHVSDGKTLHMFSQVKKGFVKYEGEFECVGFKYRTAPDFDGRDRRAIVFDLQSKA